MLSDDSRLRVVITDITEAKASTSRDGSRQQEDVPAPGGVREGCVQHPPAHRPSGCLSG